VVSIENAVFDRHLGVFHEPNPAPYNRLVNHPSARSMRARTTRPSSRMNTTVSLAPPWRSLYPKASQIPLAISCR
jgi:hypothetical protein